MTAEEFEVMAEHRLDRMGLVVKLDKGFKKGTYCIYVEYDELAHRVGFAPPAVRRGNIATRSRRIWAGSQGAALAKPMTHRVPLGQVGNATWRLHSCLFRSRPDDRHSNDPAMTKQFRVALLRADQECDQTQARSNALRRNKRRTTFQERLATVLAGEAYQHVDAVTKERLLADVTGIVFPATEREL